MALKRLISSLSMTSLIINQTQIYSPYMIASKIDRQVIKISLTFTSLPHFKQQKILNCRRQSTYQSLLTNKFDSFQHQDIRITSMLDLLVQGFISKVFWIGKKVLGRNLYEGFALLIMPAFCRASETS